MLKARRFWLVLVALAATVTAISVMTSERRLMSRAVGLTTFAADEPSFGYAWLSESTIAYQRGPAFYRRELRTGHESLVKGFPILSQAEYFGGRERVRFSPDGRWLLWNNNGNLSARMVDGSKRLRWLGENHPSLMEAVPDQPLWMPDSRRWVFPITKVSGRRFNLAALLMGSTDQPARIDRADLQGTDVDTWSIVGVRQDRLLLELITNPHPHPPPVNSVELAEVGFGPKRTPLRRFTVRLPFTANVQQVEASPRSDRLIWLLRYEEIPVFQRLLRRLYPSYQVSSRNLLGLWISRLDGSQMREIGHIVTGYPYTDDEPQLFEWMPDDEHMSFVYRQKLYTVSIQ